MEYKLILSPPSAEDYVNLREKSGMSYKSLDSAIKGIKNSWYGVHIIYSDKTVGMGRIVGDGGCMFQITDIAVLPEHQGKGLGKMIMKALTDYYRENANEDAFLTLIADGDAKFLYEKFGFIPTAPKSIGMKFKWN